ncbi:MAG: efflux RND transporter periplasmic adaptor subunit [bacterium]|nr:MAG: efflux RND transporter periplasmic adaptor subunit [bacterium]
MSSDWIKDIFGFIPRSGPRLVVFIVIIVLAFSIGLLLDRGEDSPPQVTISDESSVSLDQEARSALWTCSMHPQIKLPNPGKCPICFMDLIPLVADDGAEELGERQLKMSEAAVKLAGIQTAPVQRLFVETEIRMAGTITYDETKVAYITAWIPGRLERLYANYTGAAVKRGDRLADIYSPQLLSTQEELIQAKQSVEALSGSSNKVLRSTATATLEAAREKLRLYGLSERQVRDIETSGTVFDYLVIHAPIGGVVVNKNAKEGMYVKTGTRLYTIADLSNLWVMFDAYQSDIPWLAEGQSVEFSSLSFPGETFYGTITFIDPVLNEKTRTAKVRAVVDNREGSLKPDMFVSGIAKSRLDRHGSVINEAESDLSQAPLVIPASAPLLTGTRAVVYVRVPGAAEPVFEGREVGLGPRADEHYLVKWGLHEGELVVINGAFKIDSELQIRAKPSMMNPESGTSGSLHQHDHGASRPRKQVEEPETHHHGIHAEKKRQQEEHERHRAGEMGIGHAVPKVLTQLYSTYFDIQMALADDNHGKATEGYKKLIDTLKDIDMNLFKGDAHTRWMKLSDRIDKTASTGASAGDIGSSREAFRLLSEAMIELHDSFGHEDDRNYYLAFCPMTDGGKGAYWLQPVDTVYNSFYGASMLRCGSIEKKLAPLGRESK